MLPHTALLHFLRCVFSIRLLYDRSPVTDDVFAHFPRVCLVADVIRVAPHPNIIGVHAMDDRGPCPTLALECGDCDLFTEINKHHPSLPELLE